MRLAKLRRLGLAVVFVVVLVSAVAALWLWYVVSDFPGALEPDRSSPAEVLIDDVRLISMVAGAPETEEARAVLVRGDRIAAVGAGSTRPDTGR